MVDIQSDDAVEINMNEESKLKFYATAGNMNVKAEIEKESSQKAIVMIENDTQMDVQEKPKKLAAAAYPRSSSVNS